MTSIRFSAREFSRPGMTSRAVAVAAGGALLAGLLSAGCAQQVATSEPPSGQGNVKVTLAAASDNAPVTPSSGAGGYLAGLHAERIGDITGAADFLKYALGEDPENIDVLQRSFLLTLGEGKMVEAVTLARRLAERAPDAPLPALAIAIDDVKNGKLTEAETRLKALPDSGLNKFFGPLALAWIKSAEGYPDKAIEALDPLAANSGFAVLRDLHAGLIYDVAGRDDLAEKNYKSAIEGSQGGSLRLVQALGSLYERTGRPDQAKALYDQYLKENPDTILLDAELKRLTAGGKAEPLVTTATDGLAEALFNVASTLQQQGANLIALAYARLALVLKPDFSVCQVLIADNFDAQGRTKEALEIYTALPKDSPFYWLGRMRMAIALDGQGKTDAAAADLNQMAADRPDRVDALITLGDIMRSHNRYKEAADAYSRALERIPKLEERHWAILYARGIVYERSNEWPKAEADFEKALELRPDQPYVLNYLAYSWVERGEHLDKAKKMLERAVELRPNDGFIVDSLGWILLSTGDKAGAIEKLEQAVELEPQDPTINDHLGDAYWKVGRFAEARFQWRRALALKPDPAAAAKIEAKLQKGLVVSRADDSGS